MLLTLLAPVAQDGLAQEGVAFLFRHLSSDWRKGGMAAGSGGRMRKPGMAELAEAAGVSLATVDRALNGRQKVKPDTLAHIAAVARSIGHPAAHRLGGVRVEAGELPQVRLGVVLHKQGQDFYRAFADTLHRAVAAEPSVEARLQLEFSGSQSPADMAGAIRGMIGRCDVVAATAVNHPEVTEAVEEAASKGLRVVALLSEFAAGVRQGYVGLDNRKMGSTAAWMISTAAREAGTVAIFVGGHRWHGHQLRDEGFRSYLKDRAQQLKPLETRVNLETRQLTYDATRQLLKQHADLRGIYIAGGGMEGAIAALRDAGAGGRVALVVSALTPDSRRGLAEGQVTLIIDTPLDLLCRRLVARMVEIGLTGATDYPEVDFLPPALFIPEVL